MNIQTTNPRPLRHLRLLLGVMLIVLLSACASNGPVRHYFMQGQVLSVNDQQVVLCIGTAHGAEAGQVLSVFQHTPIQTTPKAPPQGFRRTEMGQVRIVEVFDEHYARAEVVAGTIHVNDTAELQH